MREILLRVSRDSGASYDEVVERMQLTAEATMSNPYRTAPLTPREREMNATIEQLRREIAWSRDVNAGLRSELSAKPFVAMMGWLAAAFFFTMAVC